MDSHALLTVGILSAIGFCSCQNEFQLNGAVGGSVKFTLINPPSAPPQGITWNFKKIQIFISINDQEIPNPLYKDRISVNKTTASLELRGLNHNDTGEYIVNINIGDEQLLETTLLTVFERISGADMRGHATGDNLIAGNSSVNLTCDAQGTIITREWKKDGNPLHGVNIDELNRTVSISPVKKEDNGNYTCQVSNPFNSETASKRLIVNYGPEKVNIMGEGAIEIGSRIHLTCTAESVPESTYTWALNGTGTSFTGASYVKESSEYEDSGTYTCTALNSITKQTVDAVFELSVKAQGSLGGAGGLSDGAIAGIVIMIIIVVAAAIGISIFLLKKKGKLGLPKGRQAPQQNNASTELDYADISHFQKRNGQKEDLGNGGDGGDGGVAGATIYAAVKLPRSTGPHPGQAPGPPNQVPDVTYAQVKKK